MKKHFIFIFALLPLALLGQGRHYDEVLRQVERHPLLLAAQQHAEADKAEARAGLLIPNPEVEGAYFWGDPAEIGIRWDLSVSQSFEMPSVLARRARLRELECRAADIEYAALRQQLLYEAQQACADHLYHLAVSGIRQYRLAVATRLAELYARRFAAGDCSILDYNRAQMNLAEVQRAADEAVMQVRSSQVMIDYFVGRQSYDFPYSDYPEALIDGGADGLDSLSPQLRQLRNHCDATRQQLSLSRAQWLPEMSVGYASENIVGETFRGVKAGLSLPLWNQGRAVRRDRIAAEAAAQALEAQRQRVAAERASLRLQMVALRSNLDTLKSAFAQHNSLALLDKALEAGEISLEQYLLQADYYTDQQLLICQTAHQLELAYLQYHSITL